MSAWMICTGTDDQIADGFADDQAANAAARRHAERLEETLYVSESGANPPPIGYAVSPDGEVERTRTEAQS